MHGGGSGEITPVTFKYTGQYSTEDDGSRYIITFTTSGTLTIENLKEDDFEVYLLAGGGGAACACDDDYYASYGTGGGGGNGTYTEKLKSGTYPIVIGTGGLPYKPGKVEQGKAGDGGDTTAFGHSVTGGGGGRAGHRNQTPAQEAGGTGGIPNGGNGADGWDYDVFSKGGGSPNGGGIYGSGSGDVYNSKLTVNAGGSGKVILYWKYPKPYIEF